MKMTLAFWKIVPLSIGLVFSALLLDAQTLAKWTFEGNTAVPTLGSGVSVSNILYKADASDNTYSAPWGTGTGMSWRNAGTSDYATQCSSTAMGFNRLAGSTCATSMARTDNSIRFAIKPNAGYNMTVSRLRFKVVYQGAPSPAATIRIDAHKNETDATPSLPYTPNTLSSTCVSIDLACPTTLTTVNDGETIAFIITLCNYPVGASNRVYLDDIEITGTTACDPATSCRCSDSLQLVSLYNATNGANWTNKWVLAQPMTTWYGVALNATGCIDIIDLDGGTRIDGIDYADGNGNNLNGSIPNLDIPSLRYLSLSGGLNKLIGPIPNFNLPNLINLHISRTNLLNGSIPNFNLPRLEILELYYNKLTGNTPNFNQTNSPLLKRIYFYNNLLSGSVPNFDLPNLQSLILFNNQLSGTIPNFNLPNLRTLHLYSNQLSGCIPQGIKTNCPLILATGGDISTNPLLATQSWANYWNNNEGACITCTAVTASITGATTICGSNSTTLTATTNAVAPTYLWSTGAITANITTSNTGNYSVTVSQSDGCIKTANVTVTGGTVSPPSVGAITQPTCSVSTGSVTLNGLPATGSWTLTRSPGAVTSTGTGTTTTISGLATNTYTFTVTNAAGCISTASTSIVINAAPSAPSPPSVSTITQPTCSLSTGSVVLNGLPAGSWTLTQSPGGVTTIGSGTSKPLFGLAAGTYTYTVTNAAGCTSSASTNVVINAAPSAPSAPSVGTITQPTCAMPTGSVTLSNLPVSGTWTLKDILSGIEKTGSGTSTVFSDLTTGTHTFQVTNAAGCISSNSTNVVINAAPMGATTPSVSASPTSNCGAQSTTLRVTSGTLNSATSWEWYSGSCGGLSEGSGTALSLSPTTTTTYYVRGEGGGCPDGLCGQVTVTVNPKPTAPSVGAITQPTCNVSTGSVTLSNLPATGTWILKDISTNIEKTGSGASTVFTGLTTGTHVFQVTNAAGCTSPISTNVTINAVPSAPAITLAVNSPTCGQSNGSINSTVSGGTPPYSYSWSTGATTANINNISAATTTNYTFTATDAAGCSAFTSAQVTCTAATCRQLDSLQLVALYNSTNGTNWTNKWVLTQPMTTWSGVTLNASGCVLNINLDRNKLTGTIPNLNLSNLQSLALSNNQLSGSIPNFNLPSLKNLWLYFNQLSGSIPNLNLSNLQSLDFSNNQLSGTIPNFNLINLQNLALNSNQLSGNIPNFNLPNLQSLSLWANQLSGTIPNLNLPNLQVLSLSYNFRLSGAIPDFNLPNLQKLDLSFNALSGCIPKGIKTICPLITATGGNISSNTNLATQIWANYWNNGEGACILTDTTTCRYKDSLQLVALYNATNGANWTNKWNLTQPINTWYGITLNTQGCVTCIDLDGIVNCSIQVATPTGNNLVGTIPASLDSLKSLTVLSLNKNKLSGSIPNFTLPNLQILWLSDNLLSGNVPNFNLPNLQVLWLSSNQLTGSIATFNLPNLQYLSLDFNQLSGNIPNLNLPKLLWLYLSANQLSGSIPKFILPNLTKLELSNNQLSGCIPKEIKTNCPSITATGGNISSNPLLSTQVWASYWNNGTGTCSLIDTTTCRYKDSLELIKLHTATNGTTWTTKWTLTQPITTWNGIVLNAQGCVEEINLYSNNLTGTSGIPNLNMSSLKHLRLQGNTISGAIPTLTGLPLLETLNLGSNRFISMGNQTALPNLLYLNVNTNQIVGTMPNLQLPKLTELFMGSNQLNGTLPDYQNLPNLTKYHVQSNNLTGIVPMMTAKPKLEQLEIENNDFDSLTRQSALAVPISQFFMKGNRFTFDDIVPNANLNYTQSAAFAYTPQDSIFVDTTINLTLGTPLSINLKIDGALTDNVYAWKRDGSPVTSDGSQNLNRFIRNTTTSSDAGVYTCTVTNPRASLLTLYSRKITVTIGCATVSAPTVGTITQPTCATPTGSVILNSLPATGTWTLKRNPGAVTTTGTGTSTTVSNLAGSSTYTFTVTDAAGCGSASSAIVIIDAAPSTPTPPSVGAITQPTCATATGSVTLNGLPASGSWTLTQSPGGVSTVGTGTSKPLFGLVAGTYTFTVTNASGCTSLASTNVVINTAPTAPTVTLVPTAPTCNQTNGAITANTTGGTTPFTYRWSNGATTATINSLAAGSFTVTATDASGCSQTKTATLVCVPAACTNVTITQNATICEGKTYTLPKGGTATTAGTYRDTFKVSTCDSIIVTNLTVNPSVTNNVSVSINQGDTYTLPSGVVVSTAGTYRSVLQQRVTGCDSIINTTLTVNAATSCFKRDSANLAAFNLATNPTGWRNKWNLSLPLDTTWYGIYCTNTEGCISSLDLDGSIAIPCGGDASSGNGLTAAAYPPALFELSGLELLYLSGNKIGTFLPPNIGRLPKLRELQLTNCGLTTLSDSVWTLPNLEGLILSSNPLNRALPTNISGLRKIKRLHFNSCGLTGAMPQVLTTLTNLTYIDIENNQIDSFPNLSALPVLSANAYFNLKRNRLTFDDILPNIRFFRPNDPLFGYAPQDSIFTATTYSKTIGDPLSISLNIDAGIATNVYKWYKNGVLYRTITGNNTLTFSSLAATDAGIYTCEVTNPNAPDLTLYSRKATVNVGCTNVSAPAVGTITQPTCSTSTGSVILNNLPATGTWTLTRNPGAITTTGTGASATVSNLAGSATYTFTVTDAAGCGSASSAIVVINAAPSAPSTPSVSTTTQPTCSLATGSVVLNGLPTSGTWTLTRNPGAVTSTGSGSSTTIANLAVGTYTFTVTNAAGCVSPPSQNVVINAAPSAPSTPSVSTITQPTCSLATGSVVLNGLPSTGTWTLTRNPGAVTSTGFGTSTTITNLVAATYTFSVTNAAACAPSPVATVVINAAPSTPTTPSVGTITQPSCSLSTGSVVLNGLPNGTWTLNPGGITGTETSKTILALTNGTYSYTVTNGAGCRSLASTNIVINAPLPVPSAPVVGKITESACNIASGSVVLSGLPTTGTWTINPNKQTGTGTTATITKLGVGTYNYTVTNDKGCTSDTSSTVAMTCPTNDVACLTDLSNNIPNGFTPGGNGSNDFFDPEKYLILSGCSKKVEASGLYIYNRWEELIFKSSPYDKWDGRATTQQKIVASGVYFYILVVNVDGKRKSVKGVLNVFAD